MSDLRQAILYEAGELIDLPDLADNRSTSELIFDAAVAWADLLDQEPIWWCVEHESQGHEPVQGYAFCIVVIAAMLNDKNLPGSCRMVRVRLAQEEE